MSDKKVKTKTTDVALNADNILLSSFEIKKAKSFCIIGPVFNFRRALQGVVYGRLGMGSWVASLLSFRFYVAIETAVTLFYRSYQRVLISSIFERY